MTSRPRSWILHSCTKTEHSNLSKRPLINNKHFFRVPRLVFVEKYDSSYLLSCVMEIKIIEISNSNKAFYERPLYKTGINKTKHKY